jgi:hypothetical protein
MPVYRLSVIGRIGLGAVYPRQDMNPASRYPLAPFNGVKDSQEMYGEQFSGGVTLGHCDSTLIPRCGLLANEYELGLGQVVTTVVTYPCYSDEKEKSR